MNILFICKHNRFRSKVAETIFLALNKNPNIKARSRGMIKDIDVAISVLNLMEEQGIVIKDKKSRKISKKDINWSDLIVIVADNVKNSEIRTKKKILRWEISDVSQDDYKGILTRIKQIEKKVKGLINKFK